LWVEIESPRHNDQFSDSDLLPMGDEPQRDQRRVAANGSLTRDRRRVVMSTGSHHHQAYWFTTGKTRELELLPFVYRVQEQKWIPRDAAFLKPPDRPWPTEMGRWRSMCVNCHATNGRPRVHAQHEVDTHVSEFGIACEACHGPGELHVRANRNPARRYRHHRAGTPDPTIVQPKRLSSHLSSQVCGQCHSVNLFYKKEVADHWSEHGFQYRPGDDLRQTRFFAGYNKDSVLPIQSDIMKWLLQRDPHFLEWRFWSDGMVRVSGREYNGLLESPCYKHGSEDAPPSSGRVISVA